MHLYTNKLIIIKARYSNKKYTVSIQIHPTHVEITIFFTEKLDLNLSF